MTQAEILDKIANAAKCEGYAAACGDVLDLLSKIPVDVRRDEYAREIGGISEEKPILKIPPLPDTVRINGD